MKIEAWQSVHHAKSSVNVKHFHRDARRSRRMGAWPRWGLCLLPCLDVEASTQSCQVFSKCPINHTLLSGTFSPPVHIFRFCLFCGKSLHEGPLDHILTSSCFVKTEKGENGSLEVQLHPEPNQKSGTLNDTGWSDEEGKEEDKDTLLGDGLSGSKDSKPTKKFMNEIARERHCCSECPAFFHSSVSLDQHHRFQQEHCWKIISVGLIYCWPTWDFVLFQFLRKTELCLFPGWCTVVKSRASPAPPAPCSSQHWRSCASIPPASLAATRAAKLSASSVGCKSGACLVTWKPMLVKENTSAAIRDATWPLFKKSAWRSTWKAMKKVGTSVICVERGFSALRVWGTTFGSSTDKLRRFVALIVENGLLTTMLWEITARVSTRLPILVISLVFFAVISFLGQLLRNTSKTSIWMN